MSRLHSAAVTSGEVNYRLASDDFQHCYVMNQHSELVLEWTVDRQTKHLTIQISALAPFGEKSYIAVGFRPFSNGGVADSGLLAQLGTGPEELFGMKGADIVLGHAGGAQTMHATSFAGEPELDAALGIQNASVIFDKGRVILRFSRPFVSGRLARELASDPSAPMASVLTPGNDLLWAVGAMSSGGRPSYHRNVRGLRPFMEWEHPEDSNPPPDAGDARLSFLFTKEAKCMSSAETNSPRLRR